MKIAVGIVLLAVMLCLIETQIVLGVMNNWKLKI